MVLKNANAGSRKLRLTVDDLTGKQSVRATFKLPHQVIELLSVIAGQLGIKQKSLFDQLVENDALLGQVAREARGYAAGVDKRLQKTYVISRSSLVLLNEIATEQQVSRDILVEVYIKQLKPVFESELNKHNERKLLIKEMKKNLIKEVSLLKEAERRLGKGDRVYAMIENQIGLAQKNIDEVEGLVERGMPMEEW